MSKHKIKTESLRLCKLEDVQPNPYHGGHLSEKLVKTKMEQIQAQGLWDALHAREHEGIVQLAFGHHRCEALKRLGEYTYFDTETGKDIILRGVVPLKIIPLTDIQIYNKMREENFGANMTPAMVVEIIEGARKFVKEALQRFENIEDFEAHFCDLSQKCQKKGLLKTQKALDTARGKGVGRELLFAFLGQHWEDWEHLKEYQVQEALTVRRSVEDRRLSEAAYVAFDGVSEARKFRQMAVPEGKAAEKRDPIPVKAQPVLVRKIKTTAEKAGKTVGACITPVITEYAEKHGLIKPEPVLSTEEALEKLFNELGMTIDQLNDCAQRIINYIDAENIEITSLDKAFELALRLANSEEVITDLIKRMPVPKRNAGNLKLIS